MLGGMSNKQDVSSTKFGDLRSGSILVVNREVYSIVTRSGLRVKWKQESEASGRARPIKLEEWKKIILIGQVFFNI